MRSSALTALLGLGSFAYAASKVNKQCPGSSICYSVNVPDTTVSSGSGDVFFQISGPATNSWIGMGTGSRMSGSKFFIIYTSSNGQNVTLSPRTTSGNRQPSFDSSIQATLLDGSGVSGDVMTANIKCSNCDASNSNFIWAARDGSPKRSDSQSESLDQHTSNYGTFSFNLQQAQGGSDPNPFTASTTTTSGSSGSGSACKAKSGSSTAGSASRPSSTGFFGWGSRPSGYPAPGSSNGGGYGPYAKRDSDDDDCEDGAAQAGQVGKYTKAQIKTIAHGVLAGSAFAVFFPFGAIAIRLFSFPGLVNFHAIFQILAMITYVIAFALGITMAMDYGYMTKAHPIIGITLLVMLIIQPILGQMHHHMFNKYKTRTGWSHGHLWLGRIIITLGIVNGGLGFLLANNTKYGGIVYGVVAGIAWIAYVASAIIGERRRSARLAAAPPKYHEGMTISMPREYYQNDRR